MRFKIVRKEKDGITLSPFKGAEDIKVQWKEFDRNFKTSNDGWAELSDDLVKGVRTVNENVEKAAKAFIRADIGDSGTVDLSQMSLFAQEIHSLQKTLDCGKDTVLVIVRNRIGVISNPRDPKKEFQEKMADKGRKNHSGVRPVKKEKTEKEKTEMKGNTFALLSDNNALMSLKEKFEKR